MRRLLSLALPAALFFSGCNDTTPYTSASGQQVEIPRDVTISVHSVTVSPVKSNGCQWDGPTCNMPPSEVITTIGDTVSNFGELDPHAFAIGGFISTLGVLTREMTNRLALPDIATLIELNIGGGNTIWDESNRCEDQWQCNFVPLVSFYHPWSDVRDLVISSVDVDLTTNDVIGTITISKRDLSEAFAAQASGESSTYWVRSQSQAKGGIWGVEISVR